MKVCVIGAGKAGGEAAREAARGGSEVVLVDAASAPAPDWRAWPDLIFEGRRRAVASRPSPLPPEVVCSLGARVVSLTGGWAATAGGGGFGADAFVLASGSSFEPFAFEGRGRHGVNVLDSPGAYAGLGRDLASAERVVVAGEGVRGMQVAERAASGGRRATMLLSFWQHAAPGRLAAQVLFDAAERKGVSVRAGRLDRALGARGLEAVLTGGEVLPSDVLAVVPRRMPRPVPSPAAVGPGGGVLVGPEMRTTVPGVFSAGGCAELEWGPSHATLEDEQGPSGRIAGANAGGADVRISESRRFRCAVFGLSWTRMGAGVAAARAAGVEVGTVGVRRDERSSCAIVYDRRKGTALGVETVEEEAHAEPMLVALGGLATLRSLAYCSALGSSDISLVSEAARLGLERWSRS